MRKNNLKPTSCLITTVIVVFLFFSINGCQNEAVYSLEFTDLPFLSFSTNINSNTVEVPEEDLGVVLSAFQRINLEKKDGLYYMLETSANQINVSKEVFSYLKDMVTISNKRILEYGLKSPLIPRLKSGHENGGDPSNDCVAEAVVAIAQSMGSSLNFSDVKSWIEQNFGTNGVPSGSITNVVNHYFSSSNVSISNGYVPPAGKQVFVVFNFGNGIGHASKYLGCSDGIVLCNDGFYPLSQLSSAYLISDVN